MPPNREPDVDLEGVMSTTEEVALLPVPRSVRESKGERLPPPMRAPIDLERPRVRKSKPAPASPPPRFGSRAAEARLRRRLRHAARTPEQLSRALGRYGSAGLEDPQAGKEAGPPWPGEPASRIH